MLSSRALEELNRNFFLSLYAVEYLLAEAETLHLLGSLLQRRDKAKDSVPAEETEYLHLLPPPAALPAWPVWQVRPENFISINS
jgi:hypothetical protein